MADKYSISFVLPMYNEKDNIVNTVQNLRKLASEITDDYEIIISDDASTDGSGKIADDLAEKDSRVKVSHLAQNTKFGGAFAEGFRQATKDIILYMDSDMPVGAGEIKASLPIIKEADIVTGYSKVKKGETLRRKIITTVYNFIVQMLFGLHVKDINSGYKIVRREAVKDLDFISHSPFIDVELFLHIKKKKGKVKQFPLVFLPRTGGKSCIARPSIMLATFIDMIKVRTLSLIRPLKKP